ncbi:MAG: hypothetical protein J6R49_05335 [Clostridia bacterium]|nr:hypothetical protein [Clostridia bacterium]
MKKNMYTKMIAMIICLVCMISATGCNSSDSFRDGVNSQDVSQTTDNNNDVSNERDDDAPINSDLNNDDTNDEDAQTIAPPIPSISAGSIDEVISILVNSDVKGYNEVLQPKYKELFSRLNKFGFIYKVVTSENASAEDAVTLFERDGKNMFFIIPDAKYEDAGYVSYFTFREDVFNVCIYNTDETVSSKTESASEYFKTRLSRDLSVETTVGKNTVYFTTEGDGKDYLKNCAVAFIDDDHYYIVKTDASTDKLEAFINVLCLEKATLE